MPEITDSISRIVDYNWNDEERDFEEMLRQGEVIEDDENHIFTHLRRVREWLDSDDPLAEALFRRMS